MGKNNGQTICLKVKPLFNQMIEKCVKTDTYFNKSSFIREAIRDKIKEDYPNVWKTEGKNDQ